MKSKLVKGKKLLDKALNKGVLHLLSANILTKIFGFGSQIFVSWLLTPAELGRISVVVSFMAVFSLTAIGGWDSSVLKICSEDRPEEQKESFFLNSLKLLLVPLLITYGAILVIAWLNLFSIDQEVNRMIVYYALLLFPFAYSSLYFNYYQANKQFKLLSRIQVTTKSIGLVLLIAFTYFFGTYGYIIGIIGSALITLFQFLVKVKFRKNNHTYNIRESFSLGKHYSGIGFSANVVSVLLLNIPLMLLNYFTTDRTEIGYYGFASIFMSLLAMVSASVQQYVIPTFSSAKENWHEMYKRYNRLFILAGLGIGILSVIMVSGFMYYGLHGKYRNSIFYFDIFVIAWIIRNQVLVKGGVLFAMGLMKINFKVTVISFVIVVPIQVLLIWYYGTTGAAWSAVAGNLIIVAVNRYYFNRFVESRLLTDKN